MFQDFDATADRGYAQRHLPLLRAAMAEAGVDGYIIPHTDEYQNEYLPACAERLAWISGFTGSAGAAIVLSEKAVIFTDGRYTLQVRDQVDSDYFSYADYDRGSVEAWLSENLTAPMRIGYDPMLHSQAGGAEPTAQPGPTAPPRREP